MTAGNDSFRKAILDDAEIRVHHLGPVGLEFREYVIVRNRREDARFLQSQIFDKLKVALVRPDPRSYLGKAVSLVLAERERFPVFFAVYKKFGLPDQSVFSAQFVKQAVNMGDLPRAYRAALIAARRGT